MADRLRIGVVGANPDAGWASRTHLPALLALPEFELAAVCTSRRESAEAAAARYEAAHAYWDYRAMMADPDVDVVDVVVRVPYHHQVVMAALEAGKHVYCEWPLAATVDQALEMDALAAKQGLHTMVGLQAHAAPSIIRLRQLVADGWIGRVLSVDMSHFNSSLLEARAAEDAWRVDRASGAHTVSIHGGHAIDAMSWCVGPFVEVSGIVDTLAPELPRRGDGTLTATAPDYISLTGRLADGGVATATVGSVPWHGSSFRMEVYGTEGTLVARANRPVQTTGVRLQGARHIDAELVDLEIPAELRWAPAEVPDGTPVNLAQMMRRFGEGIRSGTPTGPTFADAVRNHQLLDAIERSSITGQKVQVRP